MRICKSICVDKAADQTQINKPKFNIPHAKKVQSPGSTIKMKEKARVTSKHNQAA